MSDGGAPGDSGTSNEPSVAPTATTVPSVDKSTSHRQHRQQQQPQGAEGPKLHRRKSAADVNLPSQSLIATASSSSPSTNSNKQSSSSSSSSATTHRHHHHTASVNHLTSSVDLSDPFNPGVGVGCSSPSASSSLSSCSGAPTIALSATATGAILPPSAVRSSTATSSVPLPSPSSSPIPGDGSPSGEVGHHKKNKSNDSGHHHHHSSSHHSSSHAGGCSSAYLSASSPPASPPLPSASRMFKKSSSSVSLRDHIPSSFRLGSSEVVFVPNNSQEFESAAERSIGIEESKRRRRRRRESMDFPPSSFTISDNIPPPQISPQLSLRTSLSATPSPVPTEEFQVRSNPTSPLIPPPLIAPAEVIEKMERELLLPPPSLEGDSQPPPVLPPPLETMVDVPPPCDDVMELLQFIPPPPQLPLSSPPPPPFDRIELPVDIPIEAPIDIPIDVPPPQDTDKIDVPPPPLPVENPSMPSGWEQRFDPSVNCPYYINKSLKISQWHYPSVDSFQSNELLLPPEVPAPSPPTKIPALFGPLPLIPVFNVRRKPKEGAESQLDSEYKQSIVNGLWLFLKTRPSLAEGGSKKIVDTPCLSDRGPRQPEPQPRPRRSETISFKKTSQDDDALSKPKGRSSLRIPHISTLRPALDPAMFDPDQEHGKRH
ncbi:hypothetical protein Pelo_8959 [Pelomyxa schiedti]|nr:hypothetical protein Pelo_8959 [Pelomyxa schiedti]